MPILKAIISLIISVFIIIGITGQKVRADEKKKLTPAILKMDYIPSVHYAAFAYGLEKGYFADEGIDLSIINGTSSSETAKTLAENRARFAWIASDAVAIAISNTSAPIKLIGTYFVITKFGVIYSLESGIRKPADLKGKRVFFNLPEAPSQLLPMYLEAIGLKIDDIIKVSAADPSKKNLLFDQGKADAITHSVGNLPLVRAVSKAKLGWFSYSDHLPIPGEGIVINTKFLKAEKDRDLNCRMIRATTRSFKAAISDPEGAANAILKVFKDTLVNKDIGVYREGWSRVIPLVTARVPLGHPLGFTYKEDWTRTLELMKRFKLIEQTKSVEDYFTNDFMKCSDKN